MECHVSKQFNISLLLAAYLFVVVTHIFFIPCHTQVSVKARNTYNSIFKRKIEDGNASKLSLLHRTDKTVLNNQKANTLIIFYTSIFLAPFFKSVPYLRYPILRWYNCRYLSPYQLYISSLRI